MPNDRAEFLKLAEESRQAAEQSTNGQDKAHWLEIAEAWTELALSGSFFGNAEFETTQPALERGLGAGVRATSRFDPTDAKARLATLAGSRSPPQFGGGG